MFEKASQADGLRNTLPKSSTTITNWITKLYRECQTVIKTYFKALPFRIHLSFDMWSSPNHRSYLGIIGHWVTELGELQSATLGFHRFYGPHSGRNIAQSFLDVLDKYEITTKVGYITTDNASNNDTALLELGVMLQERNIHFDPIPRELGASGISSTWS